MMNMMLTDYRADFPRLGWLAEYDPTRAYLQVFHGENVEVGQSWIVEGAWTEPFEENNFHLSENFFGSGLRFESDRVEVVASTATTDRTFHAQRHDGRYLISNSFLLLCAWAGASLKLDQPYHEQRSITAGICKYEHEIPVACDAFDSVVQNLHGNVRLSEAGVEFTSRSRRISVRSFEDYESQLHEIIERLLQNAHSPSRQHGVTASSTLSSGYDSCATTALVQQHGVDRTFTSPRSNSNIPAILNPEASNDSGSPIAEKLGISIAETSRPQHADFIEKLLLAGPRESPELPLHGMCREIQPDDVHVVFTGYHGDKLWAMNPPASFLCDEIVRQDTSGLGLSEVRLESGFFNVPLPLILPREIESIVRISQSEELAPWRVGGSYDRPIPRRFAEQRGVPRELFGVRKKAVLCNEPFPMTAEFKEEFCRWLRENHGVSTAQIRRWSCTDSAKFLMARLRRRKHRRSGPCGVDLNLARYLWATESAIEELRCRISHFQRQPFESLVANEAAV